MKYEVKMLLSAVVLLVGAIIYATFTESEDRQIVAIKLIFFLVGVIMAAALLSIWL